MTGHDDVVWYLRVAEEDLGAILILAVEGRVFSGSAGEFADRLARCQAGSRRDVIVDFSGVDYINSEGLRILESAVERVRTSGGEMIICGLSTVVRTAFELAGVAAHLKIEPSRDAAIRYFDQRG